MFFEALDRFLCCFAVVGNKDEVCLLWKSSKGLKQVWVTSAYTDDKCVGAVFDKRF